MTLAELLRARGIDPASVFAYRNTLDPRDAVDHIQNIQDLVPTDHVRVYERMQDGPRLGSDVSILSFIGEPKGRARLIGYRRMFARRPGIAPGDIVYDYDVAHLFHNFISRAKNPVFYDSIDLPGLDDLFGSLVVQWPAPMMVKRRPCTHPGLAIAPETMLSKADALLS